MLCHNRDGNSNCQQHIPRRFDADFCSNRELVRFVVTAKLRRTPFACTICLTVSDPRTCKEWQLISLRSTPKNLFGTYQLAAASYTLRAAQVTRQLEGQVIVNLCLQPASEPPRHNEHSIALFLCNVRLTQEQGAKLKNKL